ncbi:MAG: ABC transporter permease [Anaerolineae bacterium]|nr:ABC transporter permease [Anaerolineae bacterium]MDW8298894.1 ABC transporter permease [Anaerolineae bacterium]
MRRILDIAFTQLLVQLSERGTWITSFVVPVFVAVMIGIFSSTTTIQTQRIDVLHGGDPLALQFVALLRQEGAKKTVNVQLFEVCDLSAPQTNGTFCQLEGLERAESVEAFMSQRLESRLTSGAITLPSDFSAALNNGQKVNIELRVPSGVPQQFIQTVQGYTNAVIARLGGAVAAAQAIKTAVSGDQAFYERVYAQMLAKWETDPIEIREATNTVGGQLPGTGFGHSIPGIGSMFVLFSATALAQLFATERRNNTLQRLISTPVPRSHILAGKLIGQFLLCLLTFGVMIAVGTLIGVSWGDPLGIAAVVVFFTLCATALGLATAAVARTANQAATLGFLIPMIMAPLGGAWWTLDITPQFMQVLGHVVSPIAWSQDAFTKLIYYNAGFAEIVPNLLILLLFTAVFFGFGVWRFRLE